MFGDLPAERPRRGRVLHLALPLDEHALEVLVPATCALARCGQAQSLVLVDDARGRALLGHLDDAVRPVHVPLQPNPLHQWRALCGAFTALLVGSSPSAVHLVGHTAGRLGERVLQDLGSRVPRFHSPAGHGAGQAWRSLALLARLLGRPRVPIDGAHTMDTAAGITSRAVTALDCPVDQAYFAAVPPHTRPPLIVGASRSPDAVATARFDQLAVLLGGDALGLAFHWIGPADPASASRLQAAGVDRSDPSEQAQRAARLAGAWMFAALGDGQGSPLCVAEAMAVGLPCAAIDNPMHRDLVRHGETGYLCRDQNELIARIALLADSPDQRQRMSRSARQLAQARFGDARFRDMLMATYAASVPSAAAPAPWFASLPNSPAKDGA